MKWWETNEKSKGTRAQVKWQRLDTDFDPTETLILEGVMPLSFTPSGLYLQGTGHKGTGFLVRKNSLVEYGNVIRDGSDFEKKGYVDRELILKASHASATSVKDASRSSSSMIIWCSAIA